MVIRGVAYKIKAYQVPLASRIAKGVPIPQVLPIAAEERVSSVIPIENNFDDEDDSLILLTSQGFMKRTPMKAFESMTSRGLTMLSLRDNDSLRWVRRCKSSGDVVLATRSVFNVSIGWISHAQQLNEAAKTTLCVCN